LGKSTGRREKVPLSKKGIICSGPKAQMLLQDHFTAMRMLTPTLPFGDMCCGHVVSFAG
jgi:hypothetical protein